MDYLIEFKDWLFDLGEEHGVNPLFFAILYLTSKLFLFSFIGWILKNIRSKKPILTPLILASISFSIPYVYLMIAGRNISIWIYLIIGLMFFYSGYTIWKKISVKPDITDPSIQ